MNGQEGGTPPLGQTHSCDFVYAHAITAIYILLYRGGSAIFLLKYCIRGLMRHYQLLLRISERSNQCGTEADKFMRSEKDISILQVCACTGVCTCFLPVSQAAGAPVGGDTSGAETDRTR